MAFRDSNDGPTPPCGPRPVGARSSRSQRQRSPLPEAHALSVTLPVPARPGSAAATRSGNSADEQDGANDRIDFSAWIWRGRH